jgi:hypothetical protein
MQLDESETSLLQTLKRLGGRTNRLNLAVSLPAMEALGRLIQRGVVREIGCVVELVPEPPMPAAVGAPVVQKTDNPKPEGKTSTCKVPKTCKPHFIRLDPRGDKRLQIASRIVEYIRLNGEGDYPAVTYRAMYLALNGYRYQPHWDRAIEYLQKQKAVAVEQAEDRKFIRLTDILADETLPLRNPYEKNRKRKRSRRGQSDWFKAHRAEMDAGQHGTKHGSPFNSDTEGNCDDSGLPENYWDQLYAIGRQVQEKQAKKLKEDAEPGAGDAKFGTMYDRYLKRNKG